MYKTELPDIMKLSNLPEITEDMNHILIGGTWDSLVGKPRGKASWESLLGKPQIP